MAPDGAGGAEFELVFKGHEAVQAPPFRTRARIPLPGRHHVMDALAAAAAGLFMGVPPEGVVEGLKDARITGMRCEIRNVGPFTFIDDTYNASPASVRASMDILSGFSTGRRIAVFGDMLELGARAVPAHREVGAEAARRGYDLLVTVGDLSRHIGAAAAEMGLPSSRINHFTDAGDAVSFLLDELRPGDTVLFKGSRGMKMESIVEGLENAIGTAGGGVTV
jgi:UDP-N-acetylmuramyl pentapeptide synthase